MLDLNNVTPNPLLTMSVQDGTESEQLTVLKDEQQQDDDNLVDPGTFVSLFAQAALLLPTAEKITNAESEAPVLTSSASVTMASVSESVATNSLEENVAVAWINSEYYQSEHQADPTLALDLEISLDEKATNLSLENSGDWNHDTKPFLMDQQKNLADTFSNIESQQRNNSVINWDTVNSQTNSLTPSSKDINVLHPIDAEVNLLQNNSSLQEIQKKNNSVLGDEALSDSESFAIKTDLIDNKELTQAKTTHVSETQINPSIKELIQGEQQASTAPVLLNPVSNNMQSSHESGTPLLNMVPQTLSIPTDIDSPEWSKQFSEHVIWLGQQGIKSALIKVHPEDLGPLEISIKVINNMASVNIASHSQQVRDIIDQSLPRLEEMMAAQGLSLSEVNIDSERGSRQFEQNNNSSSELLDYSVDEDSTTLPPARKKTTPQGLIDYFA